MGGWGNEDFSFWASSHFNLLKLLEDKLKMFKIFLEPEAVYTVLRFSKVSRPKDPSVKENYNFLLVNWIQKTYRGLNIWLHMAEEWSAFFLPCARIFLPPRQKPRAKAFKATFTRQPRRIIDLTCHYVHMEPFKIFALFTRNFEWLDARISDRV